MQLSAQVREPDAERSMRIAIVSRIFGPEPSAASFRLGALATALHEAGNKTEVLTVRPRRPMLSRDQDLPYSVSRFPVLRDSSGYVRGYVQYLSFDVPLFFRLVFGRKRDAIVVEPPPTTGFFVRLASRIRRVPYFYYGADVWSDAAESTGAGALVVRVVRAMERFALTGAEGVLSVNEGVSARLREIAPRARVHTVGNGVDTQVFSRVGPLRGSGEFAIYTGTASEWQGAEVFIRAAVAISRTIPEFRMVFLGQGSAWGRLQDLAEELSAPVDFCDTVPPEEAAAWLRGAHVSLASIAPGSGYDFAFPTKLFASWGCGTPTVYAGLGPAQTVLLDNPFLGIGVDHNVDAVATALKEVLGRDRVLNAREIAEWAGRNVSLASVADRAMRVIVDGPDMTRSSQN